MGKNYFSCGFGSVKKSMKEGDTFWTEVELNPGSGYVPKGMDRNFVMGKHTENIKESNDKSNDKSTDAGILKESLVKLSTTPYHIKRRNLPSNNTAFGNPSLVQSITMIFDVSIVADYLFYIIRGNFFNLIGRACAG